jgi:tRNA dimethylallyltransferase
MEYLHCEHSLDETIELVKTKTWQFAKRQMTWFRNQARLEWIEWEPEQSAEDIASQIIALMKHRNLL